MPSASEQIAERLAAVDGGPVRITGAGTKQGWGRPIQAEPLPTAGLLTLSFLRRLTCVRAPRILKRLIDNHYAFLEKKER